MTGRPLRPLLPAEGRFATPPLTEGSHGRKRPGQTACEPCRTRKTKCDGRRPKCNQCNFRSEPCQYLAAPSETRQGATKRKHQELLTKHAALDELYSLLTSRPEAESMAIFRRIRSGASVEAIVRHVKNGDLLAQLAIVPESSRRYSFPFVREFPASLLTPSNSYLRSLMYQATFQQNLAREAELAVLYQPQYLKPYHGAELLEPLLNEVVASKWTNVISDNYLFRKLLSAYILHQYHGCPAFRKELFLRDMAAGRTAHCSQLLVNAVLAFATQACTDVPDRDKFWLPKSLQYQFLVEARRLWDLESGKKRITTIQAAVILNITLNMSGMDKQGLQYTMRAIDLARDMKLFQEVPDIKSNSMRKAREFTGWGLWLWTTMYTFHYMQPPLLPPPSYAVPNPDLDPDWYGEVWVRYGQNSVRTPTFFRHNFRETVRIRLIQADISTALFGKSADTGSLLYEQALILKARLGSWYHALPEPLSASKIVYPGHISLHLEYHGTCLSLFRTMQHKSSDAITEAKIGLETLVRLYFLRHSFDSCDMFMCNFLLYVANIAIEALSTIASDAPTAEAYRSTLILCAQGLKSQASSYYLGSLTYRLLRGLMNANDLTHMELSLSLQDNEGDEHMATEHLQMAWPVPHIARFHEDPTKAAMRSLILEYEGLTVDGTDAEEDASSPASS